VTNQILIAPDMDSVRDAIFNHLLSSEAPPEELVFDDLRSEGARLPADTKLHNDVIQRLGFMTFALQEAAENYVADPAVRQQINDDIDTLRRDITWVVDGAKNRTQTAALALKLAERLKGQRDQLAGELDPLVMALEDGNANHPLIKQFFEAHEQRQVEAREEQIADVQKALGGCDPLAAIAFMDLAKGSRLDDDDFMLAMWAMWDEAQRRGLVGKGT
jgi:hypothetical protein